jgi:hypothetical protein
LILYRKIYGLVYPKSFFFFVFNEGYYFKIVKIEGYFMTVASKRKKLGKRIEDSKSLSHFDKMRFDIMIKKAYNIKSLEDADKEIGETIAERDKSKKSERMKIRHATKFPQDYPGGITPFKTEGLEAFAKEDYRTKWEKILDKKLESDMKTKDEDAILEYRNKLIGIIDRSKDLDPTEKKDYKSRAKMRGQNLTKLKNEIITGIEKKTAETKKVEEKKLHTEKIANDQYRKDRQKVIKLNVDLTPSNKEEWDKRFDNAKTREDLVKIRNEYDIFAKMKKEETRKALEAMKGALDRGEDITKGKVEKAGKAEEKKEPEIVSTAAPKITKADQEAYDQAERAEEEYSITPATKPKVVSTATPKKITPIVSVDDKAKLIEFKKILKKTIEDAKLPQAYKTKALRDLETGAVEPRVLSAQVSIEVEKERKDSGVVAKPLKPIPSIPKLPSVEGGYVDIKKTDVAPGRYSELLFKGPNVTELDKKRWAQFKQINIKLAEKVKPRKIAAEHYSKLVKLKGGNLDLADKSYEKYLRSLNLSDSAIAYERKRERKHYEDKIVTTGIKEEIIKKRLPDGRFETETGRIIKIDPKVTEMRRLDPIIKYKVISGTGITRSGNEVPLDTLKTKIRDESIALMDVTSEMARTDTGRTIRVDPKIWNKFKAAKDPIVKYEVATGMGILKSGKKTFLTTKPQVILRPDFVPLDKKAEAKRRKGREKAYLLAKEILVQKRTGRDKKYIGLGESLPGEKETLAVSIPKDKVDDWIKYNIGSGHYDMFQWREYKVIPRKVAEMMLRRSKRDEWRKEMEPKKVKTAIEVDAKTKMEEMKRKAEGVKDLTPEETREKVSGMVRVTTMKKDDKGVMKKVTEYMAAADPKLQRLAVLKRAEIKPLTEEEIHRIRETGVRQRQALMEAAELYQDQLKAQKFLASAYKGKIKPFPKKGYSSYKIMAAYRKRKPPWRLHIRRDHHRDEVHFKIVCTNDYLRGREEVHREIQKILVLMNMRMTPDATIRDVRPPRVGPKYRWIHVAVKAKKIGEGEIRPR